MSISIEALPQQGPERRLGRVDRYSIQSFYEKGNPALARDAQRVHAQGYLDMGFVNEAALSSDGTLSVDIDKARGDTVEYYLSSGWDIDAENTLSTEKATMRRIHIPKGKGIDFLPAYQLCADRLDPLYKEYLESIDNPAETVKEIAGLARTPNANPLTVFELFRDAIQDGRQKEEVWFFSIVSATYQSLVENFGPNAIKQAGVPVKLIDDRVTDGIELVPALVKTDLFIDEIRRSFEQSSDKREQIRLGRSFMFFTEGLRADELTAESLNLREYLASLQTANGSQGVA